MRFTLRSVLQPLLYGTLIVCLLLLLLPAVHAKDTVVFIHDTHLHGELENPGIFTDENDSGSRPDTNVVKYFGLAEQIRARRGETYVRTLGGGDDPLKYLLGWEYKGEHMIDALNAGGLDYNTFGNHEFDAGPPTLRDLIDRSDFQWVSANVVRHSDSEVFGKDLGAQKYDTEVINGVTVGFTGYIHRNAPDITIMGHRVGLLEQVDVADSVPALNAVVTDMKNEGVDLVVVMGHANPPHHRWVAQNVNDIDLIVADHAESESALCKKVNPPDCVPEYINQTHIVMVTADLEHLAESRFTLNDTGNITDTRIIRHDLVHDTDALTGDTITPSPALQAVMDTYMPPYYAKYEDTVGRTAVLFDSSADTMSTGESAVGDFLADVSRSEFGGDLAFHVPVPMLLTQGDTVIPAGPIEHLDIYRIFSVAQVSDPENVVLPPVDLLVNMEMTGDSIVQFMELALSGDPPTPSLFFPMTSGMWYAYNANRSVGNRVSHVYVDGEPLDLSDTYEFTTSSFMARPKSVASAAGVDPSTLPPTWLNTTGSARILTTRLITKQEALVERIKRSSPIEPRVVGRVSVATDTLPSDAGGTVTVTNADLGRGAPEAAPPFELQVSVGPDVDAGRDTFTVLAFGPTHPRTVDIGNELTDAELALRNEKRDTNFQVVLDVEPLVGDTSVVHPDSVAITIDASQADTEGYTKFEPAVYEPGSGWTTIAENRVRSRDGARITFEPPHFSSFAVVHISSGSGGSGGSCLVERLPLPEAALERLRSLRDAGLDTDLGRLLTSAYYGLSNRLPGR